MALIPIHYGVLILKYLQGRGVVKLAIGGVTFEKRFCRATTAWAAMVQYDKDARAYIASDPYWHPGILTLDPKIVFGQILMTVEPSAIASNVNIEMIAILKIVFFMDYLLTTCIVSSLRAGAVTTFRLFSTGPGG